MWIAAPTVEELDLVTGNRIVGRFLIPSEDQSYGHGTAILGPDGSHWYCVHHHLHHTNCVSPRDFCPRHIYISPLEFEDRGDGRGEVWIKQVFPTENRKASVYQTTQQQEDKRSPWSRLFPPPPRRALLPLRLLPSIPFFLPLSRFLSFFSFSCSRA